MGFKDSFKHFFNLEDELEDHFDNDRRERVEEKQPEEQDVMMESERTSFLPEKDETFPEVIRIDSYSYDDVQTITMHIRARKIVIFTLKHVPRPEARPMLDFMSGVVYALDGQIIKLEPQVFLCALNEVDIHSVLTEYEGNVLVR